AGATIRASFNPVLFTGAVVNNGTIKVSGSPTNTVTFASSYSGSGQYLSDPADNFFIDVNVSAGGLISGAVGDRFFISGTYTNASPPLGATGVLDPANHDVVPTGTFAPVNPAVKQAAGAPTGLQGLNPWTGNGITSSLVKSDAANGHPLRVAIGVKDNAD